RTDGHLPLPRCRAREQEVSHIRAGDEQDKRDCPKQHKQRPFHIADDLIVQADHAQKTLPGFTTFALTLLSPRSGTAILSRCRPSWPNALRDGSQLGLRPLERYTGFQSSNGFQKPHAFAILGKGSSG